VGEPFELTSAQMETWVSGFNSWDVCDQVCMNLFDKTPLAFKKIIQWSKREEEYVKRAAFTLIACVTLHHKELTDKDLTAFFPLIKKGALDERNYVKKAVNWALRHIGKKNLFLNKSALTFSRELLSLDSRAAKWVARGAIRELESTAVQKRLQKG
jgi:3-methyladenine DNA glycosylase AlkD